MFSLDPLTVLSDLGGINGLTGGAAGALLPPPYGTDTSVAPNAPGAAAITSGGSFWPVSIFQNFGVFCVGLALLLVGFLMLVFAWGERLAGAAESVISKIPVIPV